MGKRQVKFDAIGQAMVDRHSDRESREISQEDDDLRVAQRIQPATGDQHDQDREG
ncbi:hypothetical protein D3C80_2045850 [compost metagenome]